MRNKHNSVGESSNTEICSELRGNEVVRLFESTFSQWIHADSRLDIYVRGRIQVGETGCSCGNLRCAARKTAPSSPMTFRRKEHYAGIPVQIGDGLRGACGDFQFRKLAASIVCITIDGPAKINFSLPLPCAFFPLLCQSEQ